jgi:hypothetical protein
MVARMKMTRGNAARAASAGKRGWSARAADVRVGRDVADAKNVDSGEDASRE